MSSSSTYKDTLVRCFKKMGDTADGRNKEFAISVIQKLEPLLKSCTWTCTVTGTAGAGHVYTSTGTFKDYKLNDNSSKLEKDLDNLNEKSSSNIVIATKILTRVQEAIIGGTLTINTIGVTVPPSGQSPISVNQDSTNSILLTTMTPVAITKLTSDFELMNKGNKTDKDVAQYITNAVMSIINSISFTCVFSGVMLGSGTAGICKG